MSQVFLTFYKISTGEIVSTIYGPIENRVVTAEIDCIDGSFDAAQYFVDNGIAVHKGAKPSEEHEFDYSSKTWVVQSNAKKWERIRRERGVLLSNTDWTQLADVPAPTRAMWQPYRQALRDITNQPDPFTIVWPTRPE